MKSSSRMALSLIGAATLIAGMSTATQATVSTESNDFTMVSSTGETTSLNVGHASVAETIPSSEGSGDYESIVGATVKEKVLLPGSVPAIAPYAEEPEPQVITVIGADGRTQVQDVGASPYNQIAQLNYQNGGSTYICSAWLYAENMLATAAHCLYGSSTGTHSTNITAYFERENSTFATSCRSLEHYVPSNWISSGGSQNYDWGLIRLDCNIGEASGYFGVTDPGTQTDMSNYSITGYPGDKRTISGYTMWTMADSILRVETNRMWYTIDTAGGQSGSPIWKSDVTGCGVCSIGVHTYGTSVTIANPQNSGTRITQTVTAAMQAFSE